ncbi:hypothetical protein MTO96_023457 [Rhipicephalus appendiculatus]
MLLDGGSQRTFILEEVSRRLKLHIIGEERLTIYAFGSQRPLEERRCRRVECWLKNWRDNTRVRVEALEIPEISGDLLPPPDDRVAHLVREHRAPFLLTQYRTATSLELELSYLLGLITIGTSQRVV